MNINLNLKRLEEFADNLQNGFQIIRYKFLFNNIDKTL